MYASITRVKVKDMGRISDAARLKDLPDITTIPGFVAYYVVPARNQYTAVAIFEDANAADKWHALCRAHSKKERELIEEGPGAVEVAKGHVIYSRSAA